MGSIRSEAGQCLQAKDSEVGRPRTASSDLAGSGWPLRGWELVDGGQELSSESHLTYLSRRCSRTYNLCMLLIKDQILND